MPDENVYPIRANIKPENDGRREDGQQYAEQ